MALPGAFKSSLIFVLVFLSFGFHVLKRQLLSHRQCRLIHSRHRQLVGVEGQTHVVQHRGLGTDELALDLRARDGVDQGLQERLEGRVALEATTQ